MHVLHAVSGNDSRMYKAVVTNDGLMNVLVSAAELLKSKSWFASFAF